MPENNNVSVVDTSRKISTQNKNKPKRKTVKVHGRGVSVPVIMWGNPFKSRHRTGRHKRFQPDYDEEDEKLLVNDEIYNHIKDIVFKYLDVQAMKSRRKDFGLTLAEKFLNSPEVERRKLDDDGKTTLCKSFIDYGLFLKSLYGDKRVNANVRNFFHDLNPDGTINYRGILTRELGDVISEEPDLSFSSRFERFIDYKISTEYSERGNHSAIKENGKIFLDEALQKYRVDSSNIQSYLKLILQHIELGLGKKYKEFGDENGHK